MFEFDIRKLYLSVVYLPRPFSISSFSRILFDFQIFQLLRGFRFSDLSEFSPFNQTSEC